MQTPSSAIGREIKTTGARIAGVVACVPAKQVGNDFFAQTLGAGPVDDIVKMIGVHSRRWADAHTTTLDLCRHAGQVLLQSLQWEPASVDALIFVSQTPDYRLPASACVLQTELDLPLACIAFDVNLGCSGYPYALWLGMSMIQTGAARRVLLAIGDTPSKIVDLNDRATALLFGDAGTVTALEAAAADKEAHFIMGSDGRGAMNLVIPAGAYRAYDHAADARMAGKDPACVFMDGEEVFNFTLQSVPPLVNRTLAFADKPSAAYDAFLFHQANQLMIKHLAKKAKLPAERVPININRYGNTSSASIPLLMCTDLKERLQTENLQLAMFGFGVGYSWASASLAVGPLQVVETVEL